MQSIGAAAVGRGFLVAVNTKRRHSKLHPRLYRHNGVVELLHKTVHVVAAPVANIADAVGMITEKICVGNILASHRIGIEIIIDMQSVHIVAAHGKRNGRSYKNSIS